MRNMRLFLVSIAAIGSSAAGAHAEPASPDPGFVFADGQQAASPHLVASYPIGAGAFSIVATGRSAAIDTRAHRADVYEAMSMDKVMPGYPQPAIVTLDIRLSF